MPTLGPAILTVHPEVAAAQGLVDGDLARLESQVASLTVKLHLDPRQRRDVALMPKGGTCAMGAAPMRRSPPSRPMRAKAVRYTTRPCVCAPSIHLTRAKLRSSDTSMSTIRNSLVRFSSVNAGLNSLVGDLPACRTLLHRAQADHSVPSRHAECMRVSALFLVCYPDSRGADRYPPLPRRGAVARRVPSDPIVP